MSIHVRLKTACNVAGVMVPAGMILDVIPGDDERVQTVWPGLQAKLGDTAVAVQFEHLNFPTFVHSDQIEEIWD